MKHSQPAVLLAVAVLFFAVEMSVSRPISAAEWPTAKATASGTPAASDRPVMLSQRMPMMIPK